MAIYNKINVQYTKKHKWNEIANIQYEHRSTNEKKCEQYTKKHKWKMKLLIYNVNKQQHRRDIAIYTDEKDGCQQHYAFY